MLTCQQIVDIASDYLDHRLRVRQRLAVLLHIALCRGCRAYFRQLRLTVLALGALPRPAPAPAQRDALIRQFREAILDAGDRRADI